MQVWLRPARRGPVALWSGKPRRTSVDHDSVYDEPWSDGADGHRGGVRAAREVALTWQASLDEVPRLCVLECSRADLGRAWAYFQRKDLHELSAVDATSFVLMTRERIRRAFAFDHHFASVGFAMVGLTLPPRVTVR